MGVLSARQSAFGLTGTDEPECLGIHGREVEEPLGITLLNLPAAVVSRRPVDPRSIATAISQLTCSSFSDLIHGVR